MSYVVSDLHFGHALTAEKRGFVTTDGGPDIAAHDTALVAAWKRVVHPSEVVHVVGDVSSGSPGGWRHALEILSTLPGRKRLVNGNHDPCSSIHRDAWRHQREALEVFESVQDFARIHLMVNGTRRMALLSHYPYSGTGSDHTAKERYTEYRLRDEGRILIHGHTHTADQRLHLSDAGTPQVHVGVDAWGLTPVNLTTVIRLLEDHERSITA